MALQQEMSATGISVSNADNTSGVVTQAMIDQNIAQIQREQLLMQQ
jgi:hypothetical protein